MKILEISLLCGILALGFIILIQVARKKNQLRQLETLELQPNCLLTRYPVIFLSSRRSLFRLFEHWNKIPKFLREHGYEVMTLEPNIRAEKKSVLSSLDALASPCHVIGDASALHLIEAISESKIQNIASLTLVEHRKDKLGIKNSVKTHRRPNTQELRPPSSAIEIHEIIVSKSKYSLTDFFSLAFLHIHNVLFQTRDRQIDANEVGEVNGGHPWEIETQFLNLAIALAERDACCSTLKMPGPPRGI